MSVGHSSRSLEELLELLEAHGVGRVLDVRCYPFSRRHPHFSRQALAEALDDRGVFYRHLPRLGGLRPLTGDSQNQGWEEELFRAYADYMETAPFCDAIGELLELSVGDDACMLCAERDPYRCHRRLIADYLTAIRQTRVVHIVDSTTAEAHRLTPFAIIQGEALVYPKRQGEMFG